MKKLTIGQLMDRTIREHVNRRFTLISKDVDSSTIVGPRFNLQPSVAAFGDATTLLSRMFTEKRATGKEHYWYDQEVPSAAENAQDEGVLASDLSDTDTAPTAGSNTCQILSRKITVTGSAEELAASGYFGNAFSDLIGNQTDMAMRGLLKDLDYSLMYGVRNDTTEVQPWKMGGLVGARGTWGGLLTKKTDANAVDMTTDDGWDAFVSWLDGIWDVGSGYYPDTLLVSSFLNRQIHSRVAAGCDILYDPSLDSLIGGIRVTAYRTPYGVLRVVPMATMQHDSTHGNEHRNFALAVTSSLIRVATLRNIRTIPIAKTGDNTVRQLLYEGTLEAQVDDAHGIFHNYGPVAEA